MNVVIFGGTGFVGRNLINELLINGYNVSVITRNSVKSIANAENKVQMISWQNESPLSSISFPADQQGQSRVQPAGNPNHGFPDSGFGKLLG